MGRKKAYLDDGQGGKSACANAISMPLLDHWQVHLSHMDTPSRALQLLLLFV